MLSGFNTNYRYRGVLFHVQTEDSGRANPRVVTHLFHGGNILASEKCDYSDRLESAELEAEVRSLMETQHKAMLQQLSRGEHDALIGERLGLETFSGAGDTADTLPPRAAAEAGSPIALEAERDEVPTEAASDTQGPAAETAKDRLARLFGDGIVSEKPLDEVVLDFLVENARKRRRQPK